MGNYILNPRNYLEARIDEIDKNIKRLLDEKKGVEFILKIVREKINWCPECDGKGFIKYLITENEYKTEDCPKCKNKGN